MTYRTITALLFALVIGLEIYYYAKLPSITTTKIGERIENTRFSTGPQTVVDQSATDNQNTKYMIIIGGTALVAAIVTFAVPNRKLKRGA